MSDKKKIESKNVNGETVVVYVKQPDVKDYREAQLIYNKTFRQALESGAILKQKLMDYMSEQGVWDSVKEGKYNGIIKSVQEKEVALKSGGIPLKKARDIALEMRKLRVELNTLMTERSLYESNSVEGQADNSRFNHLVVCCVVKDSGQRVWANIDEYDNDAINDWAAEAAAELANKLYGIDPDYYKGLTENEFLVQYKFANENLRLINADGHLIDATGKLINEEGRYVAYKENGDQYFVNSSGVEVSEEGESIIEFKPFLDDQGAPVNLGESAPEEVQESVPKKIPKQRKQKVED